MEGKSVILSVVLVSLVLAQFQAEATTVCCKSEQGRAIYTICMRSYDSQDDCARAASCKTQTSSTCESPYDYVTLKNSGDHTVKAFCKLGCTSSVCNAITSLQTSANVGEVVNEAVEKCTKACSEFCNKGSKGALKTA